MLDIIRQEIARYLQEAAMFPQLARVIEAQNGRTAKVKFLTCRLPSTVCRVANPAIYTGSRLIAPLRVGDEVLVVFPGGNKQAQPIITHRLHNGKDKPPQAQAEEFLLEFSDASGSPKGKWYKDKDHNFVFEGKEDVTIKTEGMTIKLDKQNNKILIDAPGLTVDINANVINVNGAQEVNLAGGGPAVARHGDSTTPGGDGHTHTIIATTTKVKSG